MSTTLLPPEAFHHPQIVLAGAVDYAMWGYFRSQMLACAQDQQVVIQMSTLGGDPEVARLMGEAIRFESQLSPHRRIVFLGTAYVYSAGATFMSFFSRDNRYVARGTRLMIHERQIMKTISLNGPLSTCIATLEGALNEINASIAIQNEGFANLVIGSNITFEDVLTRASSNWYIDAEEALQLGLIESIL